MPAYGALPLKADSGMLAWVPRSKQPTCSPLLLRPFARLSIKEGVARGALAARIEQLAASDRRIPVAQLQRAIEDLAAATSDPSLGLRAALYTQLGDFEVLEWVAMSAPTWRAASETVCRYARILNDAANYRFEIHGDKSYLMLGSTLPLHPVAADYQLAAYHLAAQLRVKGAPPDFEVWFKHAAPADLAPYQAIFSGGKLVFGAAFDGFVSRAGGLDEPLPTGNSPLHRVLRAHAEQLLAQVAAGDSLVERVSADILTTMRQGHVEAERTAARLGMARRTMTRQLAERGTSFSLLVQEARYLTATRYLRGTGYSVEDIALLLGFSECSPFVRAFKRWSGHSPLKYRRLHAPNCDSRGGRSEEPATS